MEYIILIGVIAVIILLFAGKYNRLVTLRNRVKNAWSQIDVRLQQRNDLIPNLVNTVKGYAKHESETLERVIQARNQLMAAQSEENVKEAAKAENQLQSTLKSLFALRESYPDLKANTNFLDLQEKLKGMEDKLASVRQYYSDSVTRYNTEIEKFPANLIASMFGFKAMELFEVENEEVRKAPKVKFD
ncbi:LemA family protein [Isachenkonia alkalipeptolytica]|uniref:LemA family protein n=1 Tax=Isachenkonia alkalipeptolytica TaxID=2565777 RepID=A0AA43XHC4_9CLOT|nr:LemA family protein [Isachenkonia alkalipeptolytica]NBG86935.1 LemA family protein [Isachenkonia alkalipeptolytica]